MSSDKVHKSRKTPESQLLKSVLLRAALRGICNAPEPAKLTLRASLGWSGTELYYADPANPHPAATEQRIEDVWSTRDWRSIGNDTEEALSAAIEARMWSLGVDKTTPWKANHLRLRATVTADHDQVQPDTLGSATGKKETFAFGPRSVGSISRQGRVVKGSQRVISSGLVNWWT